jgi:hypothetical protein
LNPAEVRSVSNRWPDFADVRHRLSKRWDRGEFLGAWARGEFWVPLDLPLSGPSPSELGEHFDEARDWLREWHETHDRLGAFRLETRRMGGRTVGTNEVPARIWIDSYDDLWRVLDVRGPVRRFTELREQTMVASPSLVGWMNQHPMTVLVYAADWLKLVQTAEWVAVNPPGRAVFLREVPVPGVDTKFIERRRQVLTELLDWLLPPDRINDEVRRGQFEERYGFAMKPTLVRFRGLDAGRYPMPGVSEMCVRANEFAAIAPDASTVYIIENEVTYLAFPCVPEAIVMFGSGFAVSGYAAMPWFQARRVVYWGDLDTQGFAILHRLRAYLPSAESMLMDLSTLLAHRDQWVHESKPTKAVLTNLTPSEAATYADLMGNVHGPAVRLEQERVGFPYLQSAIR